jgi:predicted TIM-barrel fold metal-dependent hydrolase
MEQPSPATSGSMPPMRTLALLPLLALACAHAGNQAAGGHDPEESNRWRRSLPLLDMHGHIDPGNVDKTLAAMDKNGIARMVNLTTGRTPKEFAAAKEQFDARGKGRFLLYANDVYQAFPIEDPEYGKKVSDNLEELVRLGARGLKISKTLGLYWKDQQGKIIAIDDPRLDPMWQACARLNIPVSIHSGDPKAFWLPVDKNNERYDELGEHPDWAFGGGKYPSREEILRQLEAVVARHPQVTFVGVHFGNDPEDPEHVAELFRRHPNYNADIAARIPEIGRMDPGKLRKLFIEFQDRILFGSDFMVFDEGYILGAGPVVTSEAEVKKFFDRHWQFLETDARQMDHPTPIQGRWKIDAIGLPRDVLEKLYVRNAERLILARPPR